MIHLRKTGRENLEERKEKERKRERTAEHIMRVKMVKNVRKRFS